jgi:hypothetical protein
MEKYIKLTMLQIQMVRYMQKEQSYYFNVNDGTNVIPNLKDRGFWNIMSSLEKKDIVSRQHETRGGHPIFLGFKLTELGKLIKV